MIEIDPNDFVIDDDNRDNFDSRISEIWNVLNPLYMPGIWIGPCLSISKQSQQIPASPQENDIFKDWYLFWKYYRLFNRYTVSITQRIVNILRGSTARVTCS